MTFKDKYGDHFGKTYKGNLDICGETLTSLEGCYSKVSGNFNCSKNQLITLKYAPKDIGGA